MLTVVLRDEEKKLLRVACSDGQNHTSAIQALRTELPGWTLELERFERRSITRARRTVQTSNAEQLALEVSVTRWAPDGKVSTHIETR
jgi:hypothetical protein